MILTIRKYPDIVLRQKAARVQGIDSSLRLILDNMAETMYNALGIGLAAPQIGITKSLIVLDIGEGLRYIVNPVIRLREGRQVIDEEGCLSLDGVRLRIARYEKIVVEALDENNCTIYIEAEGLLARCLQHEIDHLDGVLIIDRNREAGAR